MSGSRVNTMLPARPVVFASRAAVVLAVPAALYSIALAIRLLAASLIGFPANEGSAYYVAAARNLVEGRGLVIDALWSYATPPLVLPRPAFELWQPLASFVAGGPMALLGTSFHAAQVGGALLGALLAPLAWLVAREAATALGINDARRSQTLALGAGVLVAVSGPLLTATALPDSTIPFAVAAVAATLLLARALSVGEASLARPALLLGAALGVAWLARHEAIWLALTVVLLAAWAGRLNRRLLAPTAIGGLAVAGPWLLRNWLTFGTPLPGQTIENALLTANEQIFGYATRPTLDAFLAQGAPQIVANIASGATHNFVVGLLAPAAPAVLTGLLAIGWLWRRSTTAAAGTTHAAGTTRSTGALSTSALAALLVAGGLTFVVDSLVFPVASRWGTFEHAAGPLLVGLAVAALLAADAFVAAVGRWRRWPRGNAWLAPLALVALTLPISALQLALLAGEARTQSARVESLAAAVAAQPEVAARPSTGAGRRPVLISDHPIWLAEATGLPAIALPAEPLTSLLALADAYDAALVVISDVRGEYPALLRSVAAARCFSERSGATPLPVGAAIFAIAQDCR